MSPDADTPNGIVGFSDSHSGLAWQGIVGLRYAVTPNIDVGLKYRFFNATNLRFGGHSADGLTRLRPQGPLAFAQPDGERDLQLLVAAAASAAAASAASAASGDADVPGWIGDPGDGYLPGSAASASAAASGARARPLSGTRAKKYRPGRSPGPVFFCA